LSYLSSVKGMAYKTIVVNEKEREFETWKRSL
jgi:hypothetical protein